MEEMVGLLEIEETQVIMAMLEMVGRVTLVV